MVKMGAALLAIGGGVLAAYLLYRLLRLLYIEDDVSLIVQIATPVALIGILLLVVAVVWDRLRARRKENFEEVKH